MVFDLGAWTCHWDHMVLFGGRVCELEDESRMVGVEGGGSKGGGQMYKNRSLSFFSVWDKLEFAMI